MYIISSTPNGSGGYPALQSWTSSNCPDGYYFCPDEFFSVFYPSDKQVAGFVSYEADGNTIVSMEWNDETYEAYLASLPEPVLPTASELRKQAYETGEVDGVDYRVEWNGEKYTVDELTKLGSNYSFRGETETANAISEVVSAGVARIREAFPDEE